MEDAYAGFIASLPESLLYYSLSYKRFLESLLGCSSNYQIAVADGSVVGVLPLMERTGAYGRVVNSLPYYGSNGGAMAATGDGMDALVDFFSSYVSAPDVAAATWIENPLSPMDSGVPHTLLDHRIGHFTNLTPLTSEQSLLEKVDSSARRNVKKAQRSGVTVDVDHSSFGFLEEAHRQNMAEVGGLAKDASFFGSVPQNFCPHEDFDLFVARVEGKPVASLLIFYFNRTVEYFVPTTLTEYRDTQPMSLLLATAMTRAAERGYSRWNWGGTWLTQEGVGRFKRKWGAVELPYRYFITLNNQSLLSASPAELLSEYPGFYVLPFEQLAASTN